MTNPPQPEQHQHQFFWVGGRYACDCGVWCYDLPPLQATGPEVA